MADGVFSGKATNGAPEGKPIDQAEAGRALALLADPDGRVELRSLRPNRSAVREGADLAGLLSALSGMGHAHSVYVCLNPVCLEAPSSAAASDEDVSRRRWLFVDVDSVRPKDVCATAAEKGKALAVQQALRGWLSSLGWPAPVEADSGNGYYLLYRIDLPNDEPSRLLLRSLLHALAGRFGGEGATIDRAVHNASRIARLPGTWNRKGRDVPDRPHRLCRLLAVPEAPGVVTAEQIAGATAEAGGPQEGAAPHQNNGHAKSPLKGRASDTRLQAYCRRALESELLAVALAVRGHQGGHGGNNTLNEAAFALGTLLHLGALDEAEVTDLLAEAARRAGLDEGEILPTIQSGLRAGKASPRKAPEWAGREKEPPAQGAPEEAERSADDVACVADLAAAGAAVEWLWPGWIQVGVLTALAAEGGKGKTRFCADLLRRIRHGLPWPDGAAIGLPADSLALWVLADNNHDEMVTLAGSFGVTEAVRLNAWKSDPYAGTSLDTPDEVAALERRVELVRPKLVVVDTVGNSTDRNLSRQEEAKAYYQPLQVIARKYRCAVLCLTHLNATGKFLGRRVLEKVRVAIQMSQPVASDDRRRLWVHKSNSKAPPPLGVTMLDHGNEYDQSPPEEPAQAAEPGRQSEALTAAVNWLTSHLDGGPKPVGNTRTLAESHHIAPATLYRARDFLNVEEYTVQGRKWWRLPAGGEGEAPAS